MTKAELRKQIKDLLGEIKQSLPEYSKEICSLIINSDEYKRAQIILAYMALPDEVDLSLLLEKAVADGKKVYIPRVEMNSSNMDFFEYQSQTIDKGSFGIAEPSGKETIFDTEGNYADYELLILVPGRAFTLDGKRIGRGKGYYDTYLARLQSASVKTITVAGVCFKEQIVSDLPVEPHDFKMQRIFLNRK